jgi:hypothetical protein
VFGCGGPNNRSHSGECRGASRKAISKSVDHPGEVLVDGTIRGLKIFDISRPGVAGPDQGEYSGSGGFGGFDHRLERILAQQRIGGEGIGTEAADRPER